jgi:hypothetical protein
MRCRTSTESSDQLQAWLQGSFPSLAVSADPEILILYRIASLLLSQRAHPLRTL